MGENIILPVSYRFRDFTQRLAVPGNVGQNRQGMRGELTRKISGYFTGGSPITRDL
jgi:hypothetical protein